MRTADLECEWQVAPGDKGRPTLVSLVPGGSLTFEHRNIARQARQVCFPSLGHVCDDAMATFQSTLLLASKTGLGRSNFESIARYVHGMKRMLIECEIYRVAVSSVVDKHKGRAILQGICYVWLFHREVVCTAADLCWDFCSGSNCKA